MVKKLKKKPKEFRTYPLNTINKKVGIGVKNKTKFTTIIDNIKII